MQLMLGNFPYVFDCWSDLVVHLLLRKRPMVKGNPLYEFWCQYVATYLNPVTVVISIMGVDDAVAIRVGLQIVGDTVVIVVIIEGIRDSVVVVVVVLAILLAVVIIIIILIVRDSITILIINILVLLIRDSIVIIVAVNGVRNTVIVIVRIPSPSKSREPTSLGAWTRPPSSFLADFFGEQSFKKEKERKACYLPI